MDNASETDLDEICFRWIGDSGRHLFLTRGGAGVSIYRAGGVRIDVPSRQVSVVDTVGAGDTVGAIVVEAMIEKGILNLTGGTLKAVLNRAAIAAGITCSRKGAQPPYKHELKGV